jgi:flagellar basal-body rod protein FlgF
MDQVSVIAASGLHARMQALDMLANNLANATTGGYKLDREFYTLFNAGTESQYEGGVPSTLPDVKSQWTDYAQGTLQPTGNPLDLAITGQGFFAVNGPSGPLYTRNGGFLVSSSGALTTADGYTVSSVGGGTIQTRSQAPITVAPDGTVDQEGQMLGQIDIVDFQDRSVLQKAGSSYFSNSSSTVKPSPATNASIVQRQIEASNVSPAESAVRLVDVMRQFEMLQKAISVTTDMNKKSLDEVARVSGGA